MQQLYLGIFVLAMTAARGLRLYSYVQTKKEYGLDVVKLHTR